MITKPSGSDDESKEAMIGDVVEESLRVFWSLADDNDEGDSPRDDSDLRFSLGIKFSWSFMIRLNSENKLSLWNSTSCSCENQRTTTYKHNVKRKQN